MEPATGCGITALLGAGETGSLVLGTGEQVDVSSVRADVIGIYFAALLPPACRRFTRRLEDAYMSWASLRSFEVVFVSCDDGEESFDAHLATMPPAWQAVPFSDSERRRALVARFNATGEVPRLVVLDARTGEAVTERGVELIAENGAEAYPFTPARVDELERERAARRDQTIHTVLAEPPSRDYVVSSSGDRVPISQLERKHVGVFFTVAGYAPVEEFTPVLIQMYQKLKQAGKENYYNFDVVAVSLDNDEPSFAESFARTPWLAVPYDDGEAREKLSRYFDSSQLPRLALIGPDGKTVSDNVAEVIQEHGAEAWEWFPFTPEKMEVLAARVKARDASLTLESLLVSGDLDFVVDKDGEKVAVARLVGKTVLLYFSAHWCSPCRKFLPKLIEEYDKMREETSAGDVEVVFVSSDHDQRSYDGHRSAMPWLALPFADDDDGRAAAVRKALRVDAVPSLVAFGGHGGGLLARDARTAVAVHGAGAYPFTEERLEELEREVDGEAAAAGWPDRVSGHAPFEEDVLVLTRRRGAAGAYRCGECGGWGYSWSYWCDGCERDFHPGISSHIFLPCSRHPSPITHRPSPRPSRARASYITARRAHLGGRFDDIKPANFSAGVEHGEAVGGGHEVREAAEAADRGEPAGVARPFPQLQGAQAPRQRRLLLLPRRRPRRRGPLPRPPPRRGRQVQRLLPRAGGGLRHQAAGAAGADPVRGGGDGGADAEGGGGPARGDGAAPQLQQHQLHGARQDPQEVRQAHRRRAPPPRHRRRPAPAVLRHRPPLQPRQGLRGHHGLRLPLAPLRRRRRHQGARRRPRRRRADHLPQHRRRPAHHAGAPQRQLHLRPLLPPSHDPSAGLRLAAPVRPAAAAVVAAHPHVVISHHGNASLQHCHFFFGQQTEIQIEKNRHVITNL